MHHILLEIQRCSSQLHYGCLELFLTTILLYILAQYALKLLTGIIKGNWPHIATTQSGNQQRFPVRLLGQRLITKVDIENSCSFVCIHFTSAQ